MYEQGERAEADGPYARVKLPDGQELDAVVHARARDASGTWWYELVVTLWLRGDAPGRAPCAEPYPVTIAAPYPLVQPIAGESYDEVPGGPERAMWRLQRRRLTDVSSSPAWVLHRPDCWTGSKHSDLIDTEQALRHLHADGDDRAVLCDVCSPEARRQR